MMLKIQSKVNTTIANGAGINFTGSITTGTWRQRFGIHHTACPFQVPFGYQRKTILEQSKVNPHIHLIGFLPLEIGIT